MEGFIDKDLLIENPAEDASAKLFVDALRPKPAPEVKDHWVDGRYQFFRVHPAPKPPTTTDENGQAMKVEVKAPDPKVVEETELSKKLTELRSQGVKVVDFQRQHGDWVIKAMVPREEVPKDEDLADAINFLVDSTP